MKKLSVICMLILAATLFTACNKTYGTIDYSFSTSTSFQSLVRLSTSADNETVIPVIASWNETPFYASRDTDRNYLLKLMCKLFPNSIVIPFPSSEDSEENLSSVLLLLSREEVIRLANHLEEYSHIAIDDE